MWPPHFTAEFTLLVHGSSGASFVSSTGTPRHYWKCRWRALLAIRRLQRVAQHAMRCSGRSFDFCFASLELSKIVRRPSHHGRTHRQVANDVSRLGILPGAGLGLEVTQKPLTDGSAA